MPNQADQRIIAVPQIGPYEWTINAIKNEVENGATVDGFRIAGFFGPWGSGKTTLLEQARQRVNDKKTQLETFDAWEERDDRNLPLNVVAHLIEPDKRKNWFETISSGKWKTIRTQLLTSMSTLLRLARGVGVSDLKADQTAANDVVWGEGSTLSIHAEQRSMRAKLNDTLHKAESIILTERELGEKGSLVVAIDNLDRCPPDTMVDLLESLHNFTGFQRIRFLLVGDESAFIEGIRSRYPTLQQDGARAYLEKVVSPIIRMPNMKDDPKGLREILDALGIKECSARASDVSQVGISEKTLEKYCRFAFQGNPRKTLHMFRSLPSYIGQWNYGERQEVASRCGGAGLVLHWILSEYAGDVAADLFKMPIKLKASVGAKETELEEQLGERISRVRKDLLKTENPSQVGGLTGPNADLAIAALLVWRTEVPDKNNQKAEWKKAVDSIVAL